MNRLLRMGLVLAMIVANLAVVIPASAVYTQTARVSLADAGGQGDGPSWKPSVSADGRYVAFESNAANLVPGDTNGFIDIFVRDTVDHETVRVSVSSAGVEGNHDALVPEISADGRYVAFRSQASNLVPGDLNGQQSDIFVHDMVSRETTCASVTASGAMSTIGNSYNFSMSADGRYVAFDSAASDLVAGDTNSAYDIFVRDLVDGTTKRANVAGPLEGQANQDSYEPSISDDGRMVAFASQATNLIGDDLNGVVDVFVRDMAVVGGVSRVSPGNGLSSQGEVSGDGAFIAFRSFATDLVQGEDDTNSVPDIFVRDYINGSIERVSRTDTGDLPNGDSGELCISYDGRFVAFECAATNMVADDTNGQGDVFVRDIEASETVRASVSETGAQGAAWSGQPAITGDGSLVAFSSVSDLVADDTNGQLDAFVTSNTFVDPVPVDPPPVDPDPVQVDRLPGADRYDVATAAAREGFADWTGVDHVVIASGEDRANADPLCASGLVWTYDAPLFLVTSRGVSSGVKTALKEIVAKNGKVTVHVVGGSVSVPPARIAEIKSVVGAANVVEDRVTPNGNRYDLAAAVAKRAAAKNGGAPVAALIANGADPDKFFDALALSAISANKGAPILLVSRDTVPNATDAALKLFKTASPSMPVVVGGGAATVSETVRKKVGGERWSSSDRYSTATTIATKAVARGWLGATAVGVAAKLPDALTGGAFIGHEGGALLLTQRDALPGTTGSWIGVHKGTLTDAYVFGGVKSVSEDVRAKIELKLK